jgi:hypothetical protein
MSLLYTYTYGVQCSFFSSLVFYIVLVPAPLYLWIYSKRIFHCSLISIILTGNKKQAIPCQTKINWSDFWVSKIPWEPNLPFCIKNLNIQEGTFDIFKNFVHQSQAFILFERRFMLVDGPSHFFIIRGG